MRDMTEPLDTYGDQDDYEWDYDDADDRPRPKILWGRVISLIAFMLIAFFIGRWSKSGGVDQAKYDDVVAENDQLQEANAELEQDNADLQALIDNADNGDNTSTDNGDNSDTGDSGDTNTDALEPDVHTVVEGETLSVIVEKKYGCTIMVNDDGNEVDLVDNVTDANVADDPAFDPALLAAGQEVLLPPVPEGYDCPPGA